jgi:hypothetical protein
MIRVSIYCRKCGSFRLHDPMPPKMARCTVCGHGRPFACRFGAGDFPELNEDENETIHEARAAGYGSCYPAYPDAATQARKTLAGARRFLAEHASEEKS